MSKVLIIKDADFSNNALAAITFDVIHCTGISLDRATVSLDAIGDTTTLVPTVQPIDCEDPVIWSTSNTDCCTVTQNGLVTVVGVGTCTITARCGSYDAMCEVSVEIIADIVRIKQAAATPSNDSNNYTNVQVYPSSEQWVATSMLMFNYMHSSDQLIIGHGFMEYSDGVASLPSWEENSRSAVDLARRAGMTNYPAPILLPKNCTKVRTETPLTGYGSRVLWFKSNERCGSAPSGGTENTARGYFEAYRMLAPASYDWDYNGGETFNVPEGYDSCAIVWKSSDGVTDFRTMTYDDVNKFKVYFI